MAETTKSLTNLKESIDRAKSGTLRTEGRLESLLEQLQTTYGCADMEAGEKKQESLNKRRQKLSLKLDAGLKEIEDERRN